MTEGKDRPMHFAFICQDKPGALQILPLTRLRTAHLITLDTATRRAAATSRVVSPASSRAIASSRKSIEYGFDMLPDLQRSAHRI